MLAAGAAWAVALGAVACDTNRILEVQAPSRIPAAGLEGPANAQLLLNGAISDFECAFGSYVVVSGLISEELDDGTQTADRYPFDRRDVKPSDTRYSTSGCTALGVYTPLQTARVSNDNVRKLLANWTDAEVAGRATLLATATAYEAWSQLLLAEGFCSTVSSTIDDAGNFVYTGEITREAALAAAESRFTDAITQAQAAGSGATNILNMAYLGRAKARLDLNNLAGARADAILVPPSFVFNVTASAIDSRRTNRVWSESNPTGVASTVSALYRSYNDPRIPVFDLKRNAGGTNFPLFAQTKYAAANTPLPLATGDEAQLIVAEADAAGNTANALAIINAFRAKGNQGAYTGPTDAASLKAQVIDQRRRALFLQGTQLGDIIRYNTTLTPATGTAYAGGGNYGNQRCMPLPDVEKLNNPVLKG
jgi:hypothetical protein